MGKTKSSLVLTKKKKKTSKIFPKKKSISGSMGLVGKKARKSRSTRGEGGERLGYMIIKIQSREKERGGGGKMTFR